MTKLRTANQIRAYCERRKQLLSETGHSLEFRGGVHAGFSMQAATDLPRVLDAADESWGMVAHLYHEGATADMSSDTVAEVERILDDYKWLEGENGEGEDE